MKIGIDFGTTYTKIARYKDKGKGEFELFRFPGPSGSEYIPTVVSYRQQGDRVSTSIGTPALLDFTTHPGNTRLATRIKLFLPIRDPEEQRKQGWSLDKHPDEVVKDYFSQVFREHRESLEKVWGGIESAVVSVPEVWQRTARNPGAEALRRILIDELQLPVDHLRSEPVCAAAYYAWAYQRYEQRSQRSKRPFNLLVCDMGGGTFDVALCQVTGTRIEVLDFDGNSEGGWGLAGARFDEELVRKVFRRVHQKDPENHELLGLIKQFEETKRLRSNEIEDEFSEIERQGILNNPEPFTDTTISNYTFGPSLTPTLGEILDCFKPIENGIKEVLGRITERMRQKGLRIDRIAIVGGFGQFPLVQRTILRTLGITDPQRSPEFDPLLHRNFGFHFAIAYGAALIAAGEIELFEYYPHSLLLKCHLKSEEKGVTVLHDIYEPIVEAGKVPCGRAQPTFAKGTLSVWREARRPLPVYIQLNGVGELIELKLPTEQYPAPGDYRVGVQIDESNLAVLVFENVKSKKRYEYRLGNIDPLIIMQRR
jgi:molecular chaperone DnaK